MNTGALNFFANYTSSNFNKKLSCFFNFENLSDNVIISNFGKDKHIITGYIFPDTGSFWTEKSNAGFISGNYIVLENLEDSSFDFKNFSYILSLDKLNYNGGVLLSSIEENNKEFISLNGNIVSGFYYKGFEFGVTANNYLYFEYFKNTGPEISISNTKINDKSIVYLIINNNNINYGHIDFNKNQMVNTHFGVRNEYFFDPNNLYIGYNPQAASLYSNNQNFIGYIEDIILSSPSLFDYEIINVVSGFVYNFASASSYTTNFITTGVTGSYTAITGYRTEITGYKRIATGEFTNPWGITVMGYMNEPQIKQIPLSGIFYLSGEINNIVTQYSGVYFEKNNQKLLSYQTNVINFLNKIDNNDFIDLRFLTGFNNSMFNKKNLFLQYDRNTDSYTNLAQNEQFYNVFVNGQLQKSGNLIFTNLPYEQNKILVENDFGINPNNKNKIIFSNFYGLKNQSSVFIDVNSSQNLYYLNIENSGGIINLSGNYDLFLNGQKLIENIDYTINSNMINFYNDYSGILTAIPRNYDFHGITSGTPILNLNNNFYYNNTEIYVNGVRQTLNYDYLELSKYDTSSGIKILLENNKDYIYNNEGFIK
jgi:hypothetical protein